MAELKRVYAAVDQEVALYKQEVFGQIAQFREANRPKLSTYFKYSQKVQALLYTTNAIERYNRHQAKIHASDRRQSAQNILYLVMMDISKKRSKKHCEWLEILFADCLLDWELISRKIYVTLITKEGNF